jgi:hypothetical protein
MLSCVALVGTDVSGELSASIMRVIKTSNVAVTSNRRKLCASIASYGYVPSSPILVTLMMEELRSSETSSLQ